MNVFHWHEDDVTGMLQGIACWDGSYWQIGRMTHWKKQDWFFSCRKSGELVWFRAGFDSQDQAIEECEALIHDIYIQDTSQLALF